jgi:hypothetical protein
MVRYRVDSSRYLVGKIRYRFRIFIEKKIDIGSSPPGSAFYEMTSLDSGKAIIAQCLREEENLKDLKRQKKVFNQAREELSNQLGEKEMALKGLEEEVQNLESKIKGSEGVIEALSELQRQWSENLKAVEGESAENTKNEWDLNISLANMKREYVVSYVRSSAHVVLSKSAVETFHLLLLCLFLGCVLASLISVNSAVFHTPRRKSLLWWRKIWRFFRTRSTRASQMRVSTAVCISTRRSFERFDIPRREEVMKIIAMTNIKVKS